MNWRIKCVKVEMSWIIMAVISSQKDGLILSLSYAQITQRFMKDLSAGRYFKPPPDRI